MRAVSTILCVLASLAVGCSSNGDEGGAGFYDRWIGDAAVTVDTVIDGHRVVITDTNPDVVIVDDCEIARAVTSDDGPFGPRSREPKTSNGYGYICP